MPQGEYDSDATAFVQLPPDFQDAPLAAPGHGYVPPQITVSPATGAAATDPAATGVWVLPPELTGNPGRSEEQQVSWPAAHQEPEPEPQPEQTPYGVVQGDTGQWSIPVANGELPEDSGEFTTSALASQWGDRTPPATLPGGAAAPWASEPWAQPQPEPAALPEPASPEPEPVPERAESEPVRAEPRFVRAEPEFVRAEPEPVQAEPEFAGPESEFVRPEAEFARPEPVEEAQPEPAAEPTEQEPSEPRPDVAAEADPDADAAVPAAAAVGAEAEADAEDEGAAPAAASHSLHEDHPEISYVLRVNGSDRPVTDAWIGESLLYVLRERLGLAGAKDGCSQGECGACNVQVDGRLVASCLVPAATTAGSEVRTVEGLAEDGQASDVQRALAACGAVQCGFCVPGMAMTVHDLLEGNPDPTDLETRQALCGNLCRCSGYRGVLDAVRQVAKERRTSVEAAEPAAPDEPRIPHQGGPATSEDIRNTGGIHDIHDIRDIGDGGRA
nr:(2Fe-2S)-binding protein [Streptomyces sp. SID14478]